MMGKKLAIIGSRGFLGARIAKEFEQNNFDVIRTSMQEVGEKGYVKLNILDVESVENFLQVYKPDMIISTAWETEHGLFWQKQSNLDFEKATIQLATKAFELGVEYFAALGTMSEYGRNPGACTEESKLVSTDIYSATKIRTGQDLITIGEQFQQKANWFRIFQAYGENEKQERFLPSLISTLAKGEVFRINSPDTVLDWVSSKIVAEAIFYSIEKGINGAVNIGTGVGTSTLELAHEVCEVLNFDKSLLEASDGIQNQTRCVASLDSKLFRAKWKPSNTLRCTIKSLASK